MDDDRLKAFLRELASQMQEMPEEERAARLAAASARLDELVAAKLANGWNRENAVTAAIAQYRMEIAPPGRDSPGATEPPRGAVVLYAAAAYNAFRALAWICFVLAFRAEPQPRWIGPMMPMLAYWFLPPSFLVSALAAVAILRRDGVGRTLRNARDRTSPIGLAVRWLYLNELLHTMALIAYFSLGGKGGSDATRDILLDVVSLVGIAGPFIAGYVVTAQSGAAPPFAALRAVRMATRTAFLLNVVDSVALACILLREGQILSLILFLAIDTAANLMFFNCGFAGALCATLRQQSGATK